VRLGGCDYRCSWCDTLHAVNPENAPKWREMSAAEICEALIELAPGHPWGSWVTISGGNPAIWQHELPELVGALQAEGWRTNIETQGSVPNRAFKLSDMVTFSPKGPSSGMTLDEEKLAACVIQAGDRGVLKFVIADDDDLAFARSIARSHHHMPVYVQPITVADGDNRAFPTYGALCERVATDRLLATWRVIPQLHVLAWGGARGR